MKKPTLLLTFTILFFISHTHGQSFPQWGNLVKGPYSVGYKDTVIFKFDEQFSYYTYKDSKPFFISIWYPATDDPSVAFMRFKNYLDFPKQKKYGQLYDSLVYLMSQVLINEAVCEDLKSEKTKFNSTRKKLFEDILNTRIMAKRNLRAISKKFPCIFYHHGSQSNPFDNNVFCEYMASYGFIVVSSNYNLPDEKNVGSLTVASDVKFNSMTDMAYILKITKHLPNVDSARMIAAGHSWGAQCELQFDNTFTSKPFKKIISFHTTLEDKNIETAKKYWPEFQTIYDNSSTLCTTPTTLFAPFNVASVIDTDTLTGKETLLRTDTIYPAFIPFRNNKTTPYSFITVRSHVSHDGFITFGNLRTPFIEKYHLNDKNELISQQYYYEQIILLSKQIITSSLNNVSTPFDRSVSPNFKSESTFKQ